MHMSAAACLGSLCILCIYLKWASKCCAEIDHPFNSGCKSIPDFVNINTLENFWTLNMDVLRDHWRPWE
eukprot:Pgem_evm1s467